MSKEEENIDVLSEAMKEIAEQVESARAHKEARKRNKS